MEVNFHNLCTGTSRVPSTGWMRSGDECGRDGDGVQEIVQPRNVISANFKDGSRRKGNQRGIRPDPCKLRRQRDVAGVWRVVWYVRISNN